MIILGSGIAGLAAARLAKKDGKSVLVIDKGQRIGGRVTARQKDGLTFNHGAQFFTAKSAEFAELLDSARSSGSIIDWQISPTKIVQIGNPSMLSLPKFMARGIDLYQNIEITRISFQGANISFFAHDSTIAVGRQAIVTAPAAQSAFLLNNIYPELAATAHHPTYDPCWTVMLNLEMDKKIHNKISVSEYPVRDEDSGIALAVPEYIRTTKGAVAKDIISSALTIQASGKWSQQHLTEDPQTVISILCDIWAGISRHPLPNILSATSHRWLYAKVNKAADLSAPRLSIDGKLAIAGDWLAGPRVEQAFESGLKAYRCLS